nr:MAG TPA: hypothetical protein [Caudoviricetes sp.]
MDIIIALLFGKIVKYRWVGQLRMKCFLTILKCFHTSE